MMVQRRGRKRMAGTRWVGLVILVLAVGVGTGCRDLDTGKLAELRITINNNEVVIDEVGHIKHELTPITPGTQQKDIVTIRLTNNGEKEVIIESVELLDENLDGTAKNAYVALEWGSIDPSLAFPWTIEGLTANASELTFKLIYEPETIDNESATVRIKTSDPDHEEIIVELTLPNCTPIPQVTPAKDTYFNATPSSPETKIFQIFNTGNCPFKVTDIQKSAPSAVFNIQRDWPNGTEIPPQTDKDKSTESFSVTYKPTGSSVNDSIGIRIFMDHTDNPIVVSLDTQFEEGCFLTTYDGMEKGYLDFTDTNTGDKKITVSICNDCGANWVSNDIRFVPDDPEAPPHYSLTVEQPATTPGGFPTELQPDETVSLAEGKCIEVHVNYGASLNGANGKLEIDFKNPGADTLQIPAFGGNPKSCFEFAPGDKTTPTVIQFKGSKNEAVTQSFVAYNCGNAELTIKAVKIEDDFYPDQPSIYWKLAEELTGDVVVGVGELKVFEVVMLVDDNEIKVGGSIFLDYVDPAGTDVTFGAIGVKGLIDPAGLPPTTKLSLVTDPVEKGKPVEISAAGSEPGSEGLHAKGYLFLTLAKPAGSQVILNGGPNLPVRKFVPDKSGTYTFGLRAHGDSGDFLYSDMITLDVVVP